MMKKKMKSKKRKLGSEPDDKFQHAFGLEEVDDWCMDNLSSNPIWKIAPLFWPLNKKGYGFEKGISSSISCILENIS